MLHYYSTVSFILFQFFFIIYIFNNFILRAIFIPHTCDSIEKKIFHYYRKHQQSWRDKKITSNLQNKRIYKSNA